MRDPKRHDEQILIRFIAAYGGGATASAPIELAPETLLVAEVKSLQRSSPAAKQMWWEFADQRLRGVRDPKKHDDQVLQEFLIQWRSSSQAANPGMQWDGQGMDGKGKGMVMDMSLGGKGDVPFWAEGTCHSDGGLDVGAVAGKGAAAMPTQTVAWIPMASSPPCGGGPGETMSPWEVVRAGQKKSENWREAWAHWCRLKGGGRNDPTRHDKSFLVEFLDYLGVLAENDLAGAAQPLGGKRPAGNGVSDEPLAKRFNAGAGVLDGSMDKMSLVNRVKALQRSSPDAKEAWWRLCDGVYEGVRDPNRHDAAVLL